MGDEDRLLAADDLAKTIGPEAGAVVLEELGGRGIVAAAELRALLAVADRVV